MPEFRNTITFGNWLQIGAMLTAMVAAYSALDSGVANAERSLTDHETRLRAVETQMLTTLTRIDARLSRIEEAGRQ